eukprot:490576-Prymnesium_polylepis.1
MAGWRSGFPGEPAVWRLTPRRCPSGGHSGVHVCPLCGGGEARGRVHFASEGRYGPDQRSGPHHSS